MTDSLGFDQEMPDISLNSQVFEEELKVAAGKSSIKTNPDLESSQLNTRKTQKKRNQGNEKQTAFQKACGCLTINYWSEFFEIDQIELTQRIIATLNPTKPTLAERIEEKPDLYGPFWICSTLVFMLLISESFWDVLKNMLSNKDNRSVFNFQQIGWAVTLVYGAFFAFPLIFIIVNRLLGSSTSVIKCACIYGYSIIALVIASALSVIPITSLRYLFWIAAGFHSVFVLFTNLKGFQPFARQISLFQGNARTGMVVFIGFFQLFIMIAILKNFYLDPVGTSPTAPEMPQ